MENLVLNIQVFLTKSKTFSCLSAAQKLSKYLNICHECSAIVYSLYTSNKNVKDLQLFIFELHQKKKSILLKTLFCHNFFLFFFRYVFENYLKLLTKKESQLIKFSFLP